MDKLILPTKTKLVFPDKELTPDLLEELRQLSHEEATQMLNDWLCAASELAGLNPTNDVLQEYFNEITNLADAYEYPPEE